VNRVIGKACGTVLVAADYHVNNGSLTLEAGVTLAFAEGTSLNVGYNDSAKLVVRGSEAEPVVFTSAGEKAPGAWKGVRLFSHADRSIVDHLVVEYAGADREEAVRIDGQDVVWTRSTVRAAAGVGIAFGKHGTVERFAGNRFERVARWPLSLGPVAAGGIDGQSVFDDGAVVHVYGGTIVAPVTWRPAGAPYYVSEDLHVEGDTGAPGSLTLVAGTEVRFGLEARVAVGYSQRAALVTAGTAEAPVVLTGATPAGERRPGSWPGVIVYPAGEGSFVATIFELGGGAGGRGVLRVEGTAALGGCVFRDNAGGALFGPRARLRAFDGNRFENNGRALKLPPAMMGDLGGGNRYGPGERIELFGGAVEESATWKAQDAPVEVLGDLRVDGRTLLILEPGTRLHFKEGTRLSVGELDIATLVARGTKEQPVLLAGLGDPPAAWGGVELAAGARDSRFTHLRLRHAAEGITVAAEADVHIDDLTCEACAGPALRAACDARVTAAGVVGGVHNEPCQVDAGPATEMDAP
jgi:hypothetical protein